MKKLWQAIKSFIHSVFFLGLGLYAIALSLQLNNVIKPIEYIYSTRQGRMIAMAVGVILVVISFIIITVRSKANSEEKSISFDNPVGKVKISLSAIENFIRKIATQIPGIHEIKPHAVTRKNKITVNNRVVIWGSENLLATSNKAQEAIQGYLQEILGAEERIEINMHVVKVLQDVTKIKTEGEEAPHQ